MVTDQFAMKKCGFGSGHYIFIQSLLNLIFSQMLQFLRTVLAHYGSSTANTAVHLVTLPQFQLSFPHILHKPSVT